LRGIRDALPPSTRVITARGSETATDFPVPETIPVSALRAPDGRPGVHVELFEGQSLDSAARFTRVDSTIDVAWGEGSPRAELSATNFSVRWSALLVPPVTGNYRLGVAATMKFRLVVDDSTVLRSKYSSTAEFPDPRLIQTVPMLLERGRRYRVMIEAQNTYGDAQLHLSWTSPSDTLEAEAVHAAEQADAVVMVLGLSSRLEGEEMPVAVEGFRGGDRTSIDLPAPQQRLLERIVAVGKPTVLVLLNGSALAVNWADGHVPAIVEAWYPGQAGGSAIADVLFGDYNPAGRLPVTFYKNVEDLPPFESYAMAGRSYRFFTGVPLYPFGHGLSYTTFRYSRLRTSVASLRANDTVTVRVNVTNSGALAGDEVVQLYAAIPSSSVSRSRRDLRGFARVHLMPRQTKTVSFRVPASSFAYWDAARQRWQVESGPVRLEAGASSADIRLTKTIRLHASRD
ncbi:MAG: glycoside hydrolase family 3 C-terminal domain-containing protein, partial [Gemmatimonadaceae bacterium]|nr:glycoside hydrolase family 3 C-terminal domain-containing protein [Gemmatimonadaceae bacterium]